MASDETPAPHDVKPHATTYSGFVSATKWGTILSAILVVIVIAVLV